MHKPKNLDEMQYSVDFFRRLREEVPTEEGQFPLIAEQLVILDKYKVEIPKEVMEDERKIPETWHRYMEILDDADKMIGYAKVLVDDICKGIYYSIPIPDTPEDSEDEWQ